MSRSYAMTTAPAFLASATWVASWAPSLAPITMTFAPLVIIASIWFCCSATVFVAGAYCTLGLKPAEVRPSVNSFPASTQFSDVLSGRAIPTTASLANPPDEAPVDGLSDREPHPLAIISAATAVTAIAILRVFMLFLFLGWFGYQLASVK